MYNNLKIILIFSIFLSACSFDSSVNSELKATSISPLNIASQATTVQTTSNDDYFYYLNDWYDLNVYETNGNTYTISTLYIIDGKPVSSSSQNTTYDEYIDSYLSGIPFQCFGDYILYISQYENSDGVIRFNLNTITSNGKDIQTLIELDYNPSAFIAQEDTIVICEVDFDAEGNNYENNKLHFYDLNGNEKNVTKLDENVVNLKTDGNKIYVQCEGKLYSASVDDYSIDVVDQGSHYLFISDAKFSCFDIEYPSDYEQTQDTSSILIHSYIKDIETGEILFHQDDVAIDYFDDEYIYVTALKQEHTHYQIYDWNGSIVKDIIPYDSLGQQQIQYLSIAYQYNDYTDIVRVWNDQLIGASICDEGFYKIFSCDVETGKCNYISE